VLRAAPGLQRVHDLAALTKPRLATLVVFTTGVGIFLAPGSLSIGHALVAIALTIGVVAAGTTLNMALEIDQDARMERTCNRPLPARRLPARVAWIQGVLLAAISIPLLAWTVNPTTALLGLMAFTVYLSIYTPMKRHSAAAVYVGAIPGATPIVMGWTASTGHLDAGALTLFAILFLWQIPHFIAISMYRREEYAAAGFKILPLVYGDRASLWHMLGATVGLGVATASPLLFDLGGRVYAVTAITMAALALVGTIYGLTPRADSSWARRYFLTTLIYLPVLLGVLVLDCL
jgi:protoheme IX farnesyltransferase